MKLLFLIVITILVGIGTYVGTSFFLKGKKKKKLRFLPIGLASLVVIVFLGLITAGLISSINQPDLQCANTSTIVSSPPLVPTANGYFKLGDFYYEHGNCQQAVNAYTKAITLNQNFYQAYNNRAYTYMRLRDYKDALVDLDKAIQLHPNYIQALMNRGDIHNYYYQIDRQAAIADYRKVITLTNSRNRQQTSVCGHLFLAEHGGWTLSAFFDFFNGNFLTCE